MPNQRSSWVSGELTFARAAGSSFRQRHFWTSRTRQPLSSKSRPSSHVTFNLVTAAGPLRVAGARASAGIFSLLGIGAVKGRTFLQSEDGFGSPPVAVVSYGLWQRQLGSDSRSIGQSVTLNGVAHTVIGVVPATLQFPLNGPEVWAPFAMSPEERHCPPHEQRPGLWAPQANGSADHVEAELTSMARRQEHEVPRSK